MNNYKITLLKGDGIGPEIVNQAVKVLDKAAEKFGFTVTYDEALLGGCAIDATGVPLPEETVAKACLYVPAIHHVATHHEHPYTEIPPSWRYLRLSRVYLLQ